MKKLDRQSSLWLSGMQRSKRTGLTIAAFLVLMICGFIVLYIMWTSDRSDNRSSASVVIPEKSNLAVLPVRQQHPENTIPIQEKPQEVVLEEEDEPEMPVMTNEVKSVFASDSRRKSGIIAPHEKLGGMNDFSGARKMDLQEDGAEETDANLQFFKSATNKEIAVSVAKKISNLDYKVLQGKMIEAVLEPRVNSDLPGMICATVQRDVYGEQGRNKLIPWGSRVCGQYSAELKKGQGRLFAVWNTLRRPDGIEVAIDSMGADQLGTAGMGGYVDTHFAEMFSASALLAIISIGGKTPPPRYGHYDGSSYYYRDSVRRAAVKTTERLLEPYAAIAPTIIVPAGERIRIYVNKDLDFSVLSTQTDTQTRVMY